jgi:hypothetical protein
VSVFGTIDYKTSKNGKIIFNTGSVFHELLPKLQTRGYVVLVQQDGALKGKKRALVAPPSGNTRN